MTKITPGFDATRKPQFCAVCAKPLKFTPGYGVPVYDLYTGELTSDTAEGSYVCPKYEDDQRDGPNGHTYVTYERGMFHDRTGGWS